MDICPYLIGATGQPRCGGCLLDGSSYERDVEAKYLTLKKALLLLSGMSEHEVHEVLSHPVSLEEKHWHYRNSGRFHVRMRNEKLVIGFYSASEPKTVIDITEEGCRLFSSEYLDVLLDIKDFLSRRNVLRNLSSATGSKAPVSSIVVRIPQKSRKKMVALQLSRRPFYNALHTIHSLALELKNHLQNNATGAVDVVAIIAPSGRTLLTEPKKALVGFRNLSKLRARGLPRSSLSRIYEEYKMSESGLGGLSLRMYFSPESFIQNNTFITELLYGKIIKSVVDLVGSPNIAVDLYSGVGPIAIALSSISERVEAVEIKRVAVEDAWINLVQNEIMIRRPEGIRFHNQRAELWFSPGNIREIGLSGKIDVLVMDPPPRGIHYLVLEGIREARPRYLFYVSCRVGSFAKNLWRLRSIGYKPIEIISYDMFPQSEHLENLAILRRVQ